MVWPKTQREVLDSETRLIQTKKQVTGKDKSPIDVVVMAGKDMIKQRISEGEAQYFRRGNKRD